MHGLTVCLVVIGAAAMLTDAFGVEEEWIHQSIIDLMDPTNYNNNVYKDSYLGNMYSTVRATVSSTTFCWRSLPCCFRSTAAELTVQKTIRTCSTSHLRRSASTAIMLQVSHVIY